MNKVKFILPLLFGVILGMLLLTIAGGPDLFRVLNPSKVTPAYATPFIAAQDTVVPPQPTPLAPTTSPVAVTNSPTGNPPTLTPPKIMDTPVPTLRFGTVKQASRKVEEPENVLLLTASLPANNFKNTFQILADYYGLHTRIVVLDRARLTELNLHKFNGKYFSLIVIDAASILASNRSLLNANEITWIKTAVEKGGVNLLISGISSKTDLPALSILSDSLVRSVTRPVDSVRDWTISGGAAQITRQFSGQTISTILTDPQRDFAITFNPSTSLNPLLSSKDDAGNGYTIFAWYPKGSGSIFFNASEDSPDLNQVALNSTYYSSTHFSQLIPIMMVTRYALGDQVWHTNHNFANLTIDDPELIEPFGPFSYFQLFNEMSLHNFHTTIAFAPVNYGSYQQPVVDLVLTNPNRFSLVQHGNNHDGYEFYKYSVTVLDPYPARLLSDQEANIREGLARMKLLSQTTGIPFDPIMIFPNGISPEPTFELLKKFDFLATINGEDIPLEGEKPKNVDFRLYQANMDFGNFPSLLRMHPGKYDPFVANVTPFIFELFLGKPALFYSDPYQLFRDSMTTFSPIADTLNQMPGGMEWKSLGYIVKHLYLEKTNNDGSVDVKMYANDLILSNESKKDLVYHVAKEETLNVPIVNLSLNGIPSLYRIEQKQLKLDIVLPAESSVEIKIKYQK